MSHRHLPTRVCVCVCMFRDETNHLGRKLDWGSWAICSDDFAYQGAHVPQQAACCLLGSLRQHNSTSLECSLPITALLLCLRVADATAVVNKVSSSMRQPPNCFSIMCLHTQIAH